MRLDHLLSKEQLAAIDPYGLVGVQSRFPSECLGVVAHVGGTLTWWHRSFGRCLGTLLGPEGTSTHAGDAWSLAGVALSVRDDGEDSHHTERLTSGNC